MKNRAESRFMNIAHVAIYSFCGVVLIISGLYGLHLLRRAFVADKFIIPSESMVLTLVPGDEVWVNKLLMGARIYTDLTSTRKAGASHGLRTNCCDGAERYD